MIEVSFAKTQDHQNNSSEIQEINENEENNKNKKKKPASSKKYIYQGHLNRTSETKLDSESQELGQVSHFSATLLRSSRFFILGDQNGQVQYSFFHATEFQPKQPLLQKRHVEGDN